MAHVHTFIDLDGVQRVASTPSDCDRCKNSPDNLTDETIQDYARQIADSITETARTSGTDPIAWVTGNSYVPPLRSFPLAEQVWQSAGNDDGEAFGYLMELVESHLADANVALECPENDNALYAVDLARFEYAESELGENLQDDWRPVKP